MSRSRITILATLAACLAGAAPTRADLIPISGYDIGDAVLSGHGNWAHTYDGTITPGVTFENYSYGGTAATYSGSGSGTLNDGVIGASVGDSQLFINGQASDGTLLSPAITLTLPFAYYIDSIEFYGGDIPDNGIPGAITGVTVGIIGPGAPVPDVVYDTTAFGSVLNSAGIQVNDRVTLTGSPLENVATYALVLTDFQGNVSNWISLTEIRVYGRLVPEPSSVALCGVGLSTMGALAWRRRRRAEASLS